MLFNFTKWCFIRDPCKIVVSFIEVVEADIDALRTAKFYYLASNTNNNYFVSLFFYLGIKFGAKIHLAMQLHFFFNFQDKFLAQK